MALVTVRPNGMEEQDGISYVGGTVGNVILADDLDSSYVTSIGSDNELELTFNLPAIPGTSWMKSWAVRSRMWRTSSGSQSIEFKSKIYRGTSHTDKTARPVLNNSTPATSQVLADNFSAGTKASDITKLWCEFEDGTSAQINIAALYFDLVFIAAAVATVNAFVPSTITTSNVPPVDFSATLDLDGGPQTKYQAKTFTAAQYGIVGFDPSTSPYTEDSGTVSSSETTWQPTVSLGNGSYRAYVRIAQTFNGNDIWSNWAYADFTISITPPSPPTLALLATGAEASKARIKVTGTGQSGATTTTNLEMQRSTDNINWTPMRQTPNSMPPGVTPASSAVLYDYEALNGQTVYYRVRALHDYGGGEFGKSAWVTGQAAWSDSSPTAWWLKCIEKPGLNAKIKIYSLPGEDRPARMQPFQPLGSADTIVVSDKRGASRGTLMLWCESSTEQAQLDALLDAGATLLLQSAVNDHWRPRYVRLGDHGRSRLIDKSWIGTTIDTLAWFETIAPTGFVDAWPA